MRLPYCQARHQVLHKGVVFSREGGAVQGLPRLGHAQYKHLQAAWAHAAMLATQVQAQHSSC